MLLGMSRFSILIKLTSKYHLLRGIYTPLIPPLTNLVLPGQSCECENTLLIWLDEFSRQSGMLTALKIFLNHFDLEIGIPTLLSYPPLHPDDQFSWGKEKFVRDHKCKRSKREVITRSIITRRM